MRVQPEYVRMLEALPDNLRRAMLHGDWNAFSGMFFPEWESAVHVVEPFAIPQDWVKYRAIDYGLDCAACVWAAFDPQGNGYIYRDFAQKDLIISGAAREILGRTDQREEIRATFAPADIWGRSRDTGLAQAELFGRNGLPLTYVRNGRAEGWLTVKEWLKVQEGAGETQRTARLRVFSTCTELIRCLPLLCFDVKRVGDAATTPHEITHITDALRYLLDGCTRVADSETAEPGTAGLDYGDEPQAYDTQAQGFLRYDGG